MTILDTKKLNKLWAKSTDLQNPLREPADLDFYGLELSDGMRAVKFSQPFLFEIEVEFEESR